MKEQRSMPIYTFGEITGYLLKGHKVKRAKWDDDIHIYCNNLKDIYINGYEVDRQWKVLQEDVLATDWLVIFNV
jgi:hypothetical protein